MRILRIGSMLLVGSLSIVMFQNFTPASHVPVCGDAVMANLLAPLTEQSKSVKIACHPRLKSTDVITKQVILEGSAASGVVFDCKGGKIDFAGDSILIRSREELDINNLPSWVRPEDVTVRNCVVHGAIRIRGLASNGEGELLRASSRVDANHTARAQAAAPTRILLENLRIIGRGRNPLYIAPGSTHVVFRNSKIEGKSDGVAIYLDAESEFNVIQNNDIGVDTKSREQIAVDGSASNRIVGNRISGLNQGGIYLYRNCGEGGTVRHQTPSYNHIINNVFYYNKYNGPAPAVWVASRNGNRSYCDHDRGFAWGSSVSDRDFARHNVIAQNRFFALSPESRIRLNEEPNLVTGNQKVSEAPKRASACYLDREKTFIASGKSSVLTRGDGREERCHKVSCEDGILTEAQEVACPVRQSVDFSCRVERNNKGCTKTVACPTGWKIRDVKAACNLEYGSISDSVLGKVPWNKVQVVRASDRVRDGVCSVHQTRISSGEAALSLRDLKQVAVHCSEHDKNGSDCEIKGQLLCVPQ